MKARVVRSMLFGVALTVFLTGSASAQTGSTQTTPPPPPPKPAAPPASPAPEPKADVAFGYSFLREAGVDGAPANVYAYGWTAAYSQKIGSWPIAAVGEITGNYRHDDNDDLWQLYAYLGGVRFGFYRHGGFSAFGQALFGAEQFKTPGFSETGFAFQPGGGVDVPLGERMKFRFQVDFRLANQSVEDTTFKELRLAGSVVIPIK